MQRALPELRDRPVIVGGGRRGVAATCCYIARQYGVHSAMPMFKALKACPDAVVIKPDFTKYVAESKRIFDAIGRLTPLVQTLSLDEAWIDLSGTERLNGGPPALQLVQLQAWIEAETGLTVSIGLAANRFLAKIASELDKPRGFSVLGSEAAVLLGSKPVSILPGVGPVFSKTLRSDGYATIGDLAAADPRDLIKQYGESGLRLHDLANGRALMTPELGIPYRLIGVGMGEIAEAVDAPSSLFENAEARTLKTETAIDALRAKFGKDAVVAGRALKR